MFNFLLFASMRLHFNNPPAAWAVTAAAAIVILAIFHFPVMSVI